MKYQQLANQPVDYLTKVKKETAVKPVKKVTPFTSDEARQEKKNFKQYLREVEECQNSNDEFSDIQMIGTSSITKKGNLVEAVFKTHDKAGTSVVLTIDEEDFDALLKLARGTTDTIVDRVDLNEDLYSGYLEWHVTRSSMDNLVFEKSDGTVSGQFNFRDVVRRLHK